MRRPLVAGNWKMNGSRRSARALIEGIVEGLGTLPNGVDLLVCPPATLIGEVAALVAAHPVALGGQDCHAKAKGAHTGDVAAEMLADCGAGYVIVGHSERRADHGESDHIVRAKAAAARRAGLVAIVCVGETLEQRDSGATLDIIARQLAGSLPEEAAAAGTVVAYEPVWAIGTGRTPTLAQIAEVHGHIRRELAMRVDDAAAVRILYGGSVKPGNAQEILALDDVDGALVGGASLDAGSFLAIAASCP